ncbi:MAG: MFS transporter [Propionibacteriales bacterium]|nr:MFS transporter [Propionibacteriales bacterium]
MSALTDHQPDDPTPGVIADPRAVEHAPLAADKIIGQSQGPQFLPLFVLAWFGVNLAVAAMMGAAIPKAMLFLDEVNKEENTAMITAIGGVAVMIITPLFGRLSDRTMTRWGMRKPWMLGGLVVGLGGVIVLALAASIPMMIIGWVIVQVGFGATAMAQHALLAAQIPTRIRARVAAAVGVASGISTIAAAAIVAGLPNDAQPLWFLVPGAIGTLCALFLIIGYRDAVRTEPAPALSLSEVLSTYWLDPVRYRDFFWAWACRFLVTMSIFTVSLFLLFLIVDVLKVPKEQASGILALALSVFFVGNIVSTVLFGWISDRTKRRKPIIWASCFISAIGLLVCMFAGDQTQFLIGIAIVGAGQGAYISVDVAMMTEVLPSAAEAGKDLGIVALSYQLPQVLGPILGAVVISTAGGQNYTGLFGYALVLSVLGGLAVLPIRAIR